MKATSIANSNIAFIKYWGKKDEVLRLPANGSISMTLDDLSTTTTVEFDQKYLEDEVIIDEKKADEKAKKRVIDHLDRIRKIADIQTKAKVISINNFPIGTGLSSSASAFAALTLAGSSAAGLDLSQKELSILSRQGSGSSSRSIQGGFVQWLDGNTSEDSYCIKLQDENYWDLIDIIVIVSTEKKEISSTIGQTYARTSPFYKKRLECMKSKIDLCKELIKKKEFTKFGQLIEHEALEMHSIMITSTPSLLYWTPQSLMLMKEVQKWRKEGLESYFTINTGQDVHIICQNKDKEKVINKLQSLDYVKDIRPNMAGKDARIIKEHLF